MLPAPDRAIVRLSAGTASPDAVPPTLRDRLERAGLRLDRPAGAGVGVALMADGWDRANLAALVASARAHPGVTVAWEGVARAREGGPVDLSGPPQVVLAAGPPLESALLDRDGTVILDREYLSDPDGVELLPGAAAGLRRLAAVGVRLVILTNQSGVGRGLITPAALDAIHTRLTDLLARENVTLAGIFACPHDPAARCDCRKPAPGLADQAAAGLGLDLGRAVVAGDQDADLGLARRLGVPAILLLTGEGRRTLAAGAEPADFIAEDLEEVARLCGHPAGIGVPAVRRAA